MRAPGRAAALVLSTLMAAGCARAAPGWVESSHARYTSVVTLPAPATDGGMSLVQALAGRRSVRQFRAEALPLATVGQLLWAGQGVTSADGRRAAPSAGALYPLELYVVTGDRFLHYLAEGHRVELRSTPDLRPQLRAGADGQSVVAEAPDVIVVAADPGRTRTRYGPRAEAFVQMEAGHAAENILLQATALGLGAVPVGSVQGVGLAAALALPPGQTVLYLIPVGYPFPGEPARP